MKSVGHNRSNCSTSDTNRRRSNPKAGLFRSNDGLRSWKRRRGAFWPIAQQRGSRNIFSRRHEYWQNYHD
jgi:hypothetical protein